MGCAATAAACAAPSAAYKAASGGVASADVNEGDAITETGMTSEFLSVSVNKFAGGQEFSVELLDRSSPVFFDILVSEMEKAYLKATNSAVLTQLATSGTDGGNRTMSNVNFQDFISDAAVSIYSILLDLPKIFLLRQRNGVQL